MAARGLKPAGLGLAAAGLAAGGWALRNRRAHDWARARTRRAGFTERRVELAGCTLTYAAGSAAGTPPLLLIHGQGADWRNYAPVVVSGHSSGGQLAAWLAGHRPDLVRAAVLEDPPLFTTLLPRAEQTWNWADPATTCHAFLRSGEPDWIAYQFAHQKMWECFGGSADRIVRSGLARHAAHPDRPIGLWYLPPSWNDLQRSIAAYDPRFGAAFHSGSRDEGFDHEQTLRAIEAPTTLIHANWKYGPDGLLQGAIDGADARRIVSLIADAELVEVNSGHDVHGGKPGRSTDLVGATARRAR
ncbi:alpha/beta fold hydrolase [Amycolatopsis jiangsuensis]|uniref:Pimeloyl-ACP methyl ester carboxylesterase n=1 Tax=Amycolatopsis jiangsuensis TaxID=1181879 RepID=A0A840J4Q8_9PSEU|nr:alpha/beta hydrolase [Amycolatopsis jiangsuensis]MBB4688823.1 pimeloyl-ACP methyl ester carboxylesterase [Amycolatopsis jiangsuensis]